MFSAQLQRPMPSCASEAATSAGMQPAESPHRDVMQTIYLLQYMLALGFQGSVGTSTNGSRPGALCIGRWKGNHGAVYM